MDLLTAKLLVVSISLVTAYHRSDVVPGTFCGKGLALGGGCCQPPQPYTECGHNIDFLTYPGNGTQCYCDSECNDTDVDYCCPDYPDVCLGNHHIIKIQPIDCQLGQTKMDQCNKCTCKEMNGILDWSCEQDVCVFSHDVLRGLIKDHSSWRGDLYRKYDNKKLSEMLKYRLGTKSIDASMRRILPVIINREIEYPQRFDARLSWRTFISPIQDQGWCGSDWAVSTASVMSDRYAIQSHGAEAVLLSAQTLLSCTGQNHEGCDGEHVDRAWKFVRKCGIVDEKCYPYQASASACKFWRHADLLESGCIPPQNSNRTSRYKSGSTYRLTYEKDIMWEIMSKGPVLAVMTVYQDFFHYRDGVYRHTRHGDQVLKGSHSVKIVGWGETADGLKYWIVANSWGRDWGMNGYFNIARGINESGIETLVIAANRVVG